MAAESLAIVRGGDFPDTPRRAIAGGLRGGGELWTVVELRKGIAWR